MFPSLFRLPIRGKCSLLLMGVGLGEDSCPKVLAGCPYDRGRRKLSPGLATAKNKNDRQPGGSIPSHLNRLHCGYTIDGPAGISSGACRPSTKSICLLPQCEHLRRLTHARTGSSAPSDVLVAGPEVHPRTEPVARFNPGHARAGEYAGLTPVTKSATESGGRLASYVDRIVRGEKPAHVGCMQVFRTICYWPARSPSGLPAISIPAAPRGRGRASADLTPSLRNRWFADSPLEGTGFEPSLPLKALGALVVSVLVRADFSVGGNQTEAT